MQTLPLTGKLPEAVSASPAKMQEYMSLPISAIGNPAEKLAVSPVEKTL